MRIRGLKVELEPRTAWRLTLVIVGLAAILVYLNSLANGFAYDDYWIVESREVVHHGLGRLSRLLTIEYWPEGFHGGLYRPFTLLTYAVDWRLWGGAPFGFHLTNVLLHAGVTVLVALLLMEFFPWWAALGGGLVFAIHPVHTEAVANVVGRAELLTAAFVLVASWIYVRAGHRGGISWKVTAFITICYGLAMFSKESGVVLPGLLIAADLVLAPRRFDRIRDYCRSRLPIFAVLAGTLALYLTARWQVLGAPLGNVPDRAFGLDDSFPTRLFTMARVWPRYLELLLFPTQLSADYSPAVILPVEHLTPLGTAGLALVIGLLGLAVVGYRSVPEYGFAVGWFAVAILPVSNLIVVAEIVLAERTLYLPSVAVAVVMALALARATRPTRRWLALGLAAWVLAFSVKTVRRNPVWESTQSVFEDLRRHHPESSRLLWEMGKHYTLNGEWERAREWFRKSLEIWPYHAPYLAEFALYLKEQGELAEAEERAVAAAELRPDHPDHHSLLAVIRLQRGDAVGALRAVERGLAEAPQDPVLHTLRADALAAQGEYGRAVEAQMTALETSSAPKGGAWLRLARLQAAAGDTASALETIERARSIPGAPTPALDSLREGLRANAGRPGVR